MWIALGIGRKAMQWLEAATGEDPSLLAHGHPARSAIDLLVGRLVAIGVAEAHEFEKRVAPD